jgi:oligopeptide transport system permease protein
VKYPGREKGMVIGMDNTLISFKRIPCEEKQADVILRPPSTFAKDAWYRFSRNKLGLIGAAFILFMIFLAVFGPQLSKWDYQYQNLSEAFQTPSKEHLMGTDNLGRDLMIRIIYGARISLIVGFSASIISVVIGVFYGAISGYAGGITDTVMMRFVEIVDSVPSTLYIILLAQVVQKGGIINIIAVIGFTSWLGMARLVRGEVLSLKSREFVLAAKVSNISNLRILTRHLIPNCLGPIIVSLTLSIPSAIFVEAALRFLGIMSLATPSWGSLASDGIKVMRACPHMIIFPSIFISLTMLAFNFLGDALRDALDPKMR